MNRTAVPVFAAALLASACSGTRIIDYRRSEVAREGGSITAVPLPGIIGGARSSVDWVPADEFPMTLADRSDVTYRPDRFPGSPGIAKLVEKILLDEGVPRELAALPWIESSYQVGCYSSAGAAGPWQIMRSTGTQLDLRIDSEIDERYSWTASTRAAARYLQYLHGLFGSWGLALAAYNCGEGAVQRASCRGGTSLENLDLPGETRSFVPRFVNALRAYQSVDMTGESLAVIWAPPGLDLRLLAASAGILPESLVMLNREFLNERTPSYGEGWEMIVPASAASAAYSTAWTMDTGGYTVRDGDTWDSISLALGVETGSMRAANPAASLVPGTRLALPEPESIPVNVASGENEGYFYYTIRSGDTLSGIAQTVGASSADVAVWNDMSREAIIHPGQRILLRGTPPAGADAAPAPAVPAQPPDSGVTHTVVQGDTLWDLSLRYGVSVEQIQALNQMSGNNLRIGQVLVIRVVE